MINARAVGCGSGRLKPFFHSHALFYEKSQYRELCAFFLDIRGRFEIVGSHSVLSFLLSKLLCSLLTERSVGCIALDSIRLH